jgi:hypothetical protein
MNTTILIVNYNSTSLTERLLQSIIEYKYYHIPITIIDGSDQEIYIQQMKNLISKYNKTHNMLIDLHSMGYNIHHGTGMNYGLHLITTKYVLIMDNDTYFTSTGSIEIMLEKIQSNPKLLFIGCQMFVNESGFAIINNAQRESHISKFVPSGLTEKTSTSITNEQLIKYIHPSFMFVNREKYVEYVKNKKHRPFIKHGAPCLTTMFDIKQSELSDEILLDMSEILLQHFVHDWNGVVKSSGGYHLSKQHHFGNVEECYLDLPSDNIQEYLDNQSQFDTEIEKQDLHEQGLKTVQNNPKKYFKLKGKKKLNKKELHGLQSTK